MAFCSWISKKSLYIWCIIKYLKQNIMYIGENYDFESLLCLSGNTLTGNYKIIGHTKINESECIVLKNYGSNNLEIATILEADHSIKK